MGGFRGREGRGNGNGNGNVKGKGKGKGKGKRKQGNKGCVSTTLTKERQNKRPILLLIFFVVGINLVVL